MFMYVNKTKYVAKTVFTQTKCNLIKLASFKAKILIFLQVAVVSVFNYSNLLFYSTLM